MKFLCLFGIDNIYFPNCLFASYLNANTKILFCCPRCWSMWYVKNWACRNLGYFFKLRNGCVNVNGRSIVQEAVHLSSLCQEKTECLPVWHYWHFHRLMLCNFHNVGYSPQIELFEAFSKSKQRNVWIGNSLNC